MPEKVIPKPIRFTTRGFIHRRFTFKERLQILLGYSMMAEIHVASEHNPGQTQPVARFHIMPYKDPAGALVALRDEAARSTKPSTSPVKQ